MDIGQLTLSFRDNGITATLLVYYCFACHPTLCSVVLKTDQQKVVKNTHPLQYIHESHVCIDVRIPVRMRYITKATRFAAAMFFFNTLLWHADWLRKNCKPVLPNTGPTFGTYKGDDGLWCLGKISATTPTDGAYLVRFFSGDPESTKLPLSPARYTTSTRDVREGLGVCKHTWLTRLHGGSTVT